jgi:diguanylate cyclase (GGDEF)-like protein/PAS domain S-box-containing protein
MTRVLVLAAPIAGAVAILAGVAGLLPAVQAVTLGVGIASGGYSWLLLHGRRGCRPASFLGAGVLISGLSTVGAGLAHGLAPHARAADVPLPAEIPLVGLFFTAGMYLLGLLTRRGAAQTVTGRLRRCLDAVGIGVCAFFIAWLLLFDRAGLRGAALTGVLLACIAVSVIVVAGLRTVRYQPIAVLCAVGPTLSVFGQTGLTVALDYFAWSGWVLLSGALMVVGPALTWYGIRAAESDYRRPPADDTDGSYAGYPLLALPLGAALLAAAYHVLERRPFDSISIVLTIVGVAVLALREALGSVDIRRYAAKLATQEAHFRSLVVGSTDVTVVLDGALVVRWQSPAAARQLGLSDQEVVGRPLMSLVHPDDADEAERRLRGALAGADAESGALAGALARAGADAESEIAAESAAEIAAGADAGFGGADGGNLVEARMRDGYGAWRDTEWSLSDQRASPAVGGLVVHVRDVSERKELERTLHRTAYVDQLTGLPNRRELRRAVAAQGGTGALMVVGLGGVAGVNEVRGHDVGDAVLVEAARRLRAGVSPADVLARLGGDRFAVATHGGAVQAQLLATRLLTMLTEPYAVAGATAHLSASVGLAELGPEVADDEVLRRAELALRRAGRRGRGGVEWYDTSLEELLRRRLVIEQELPGVVGRGELDLVYQPVVELAGQRAVGAEALLRWRHPTLGAVPPAEFVPVAEELGLLDEIGEWVLHRVGRQLSSWLRDGRDLWVSVNATAGQLASPAFPAAVSVALDAHQVPPSRLVVEIAEDGLAASRSPAPVDPAADDRANAIATHLGELRALGVSAAVDHFGSAATSLRQLRVLPVDLLKVDRQLFTEPAGHSGPATAVVDVVVKLSAQIGLEVIAQGLESAADLDAARAAGCRFGQGYVLSRPAPPERLEAYLDVHRSRQL